MGSEVALSSFRAASRAAEIELEHNGMECQDCWYWGVFCPCILSKYHPGHPDRQIPHLGYLARFWNLRRRASSAPDDGRCTRRDGSSVSAL